MKTFEKRLPTEDADIREIVAAMIAVQARFAAKQHRPLGRGTHTKGVCVRGSFEVFDLEQQIKDPSLRARLAHGLFAKTGVYPATVRFANAASTIEHDFKPDVRAISFAVELPTGLLSPDVSRLDFSMNDRPTFPINDAHGFAVLMRVLSARGVLGLLRALVSLSPLEFWRVVKISVRGARQKLRSVRPYQKMRYWSTVPFRHGPDAAAKYSLIPSPENSGQKMRKSDNMLRDELVRSLSDETRTNRFDFGVQLLDADCQRHRFRRRDEVFWVENASVEWKEQQAPFHVLGRLTLEPRSLLPDEACKAFYVDVNQHSTPESHPLGSINRARWFAESASRVARLGGEAPALSPDGVPLDSAAFPAARDGAPLPAPAAPLGSWIGRLTLGSLVKGLALVGLIGLLLVAGLGLATMTYLHFGGGMLPEENVDRVDYPDQGWGAGVEAADRQAFYYTPQGAGLKNVRYSWFVNLEMPWGKKRFADPSVLRRYGFLVDEQTEWNPDRLPVGFTKHFDRELNEELLDITCAACHTGQLHVTRDGRTRALRIDGGQANHAFTDSDIGNFVPTMLASMAGTAANPLKFRRFAQRVLGDGYPRGSLKLHRELRKVISTFAGISWNEKIRRSLYPTQEGYGRTDALARIANTVFAENLVPSNYAVGNAPVSYPPLWNIWKFDWVQYGASVSQPMARNLGETLGVGARYALLNRYGGPLPPEQRFRTTTLIRQLHAVEESLRVLKPPRWDEGILGAIDHQLAERGRVLFDRHCVSCHGPHIAPAAIKTRNAPLKTDADPEWLMRTLCVDDIGTDPNAALNFVEARVDITRTGMTAMQLRQVARRTLDQWRERQSAYLEGEVARLRVDGSAAAMTRAAGLERELAGLSDEIEQQLSQIEPQRLSVGAALSYLGTLMREQAYRDGGYSEAQRRELDGFGILDMPRSIAAYRSRPLAGIWATPPFLHNGSVPRIYDLLSPVDQRPKEFQVGSREYDPKHLGLAADVEGFWTFDTTKTGNSNRGHEFHDDYDESAGSDQVRPGLIGPLLSDEERMAILEHLKVRDDDRDGPQEPKIPETPLCRVRAADRYP